VAIDFKCPACGMALALPDRLAGRQGACPACNTVVDVPAAVPTTEPSADEEEEAPPPLASHGESIRVEDLVDMTAMVDIVFFLLIFFLVTSMQGLASTIGLPNPDPQKAAAKGQATAGALDPSFLVVKVDQDSMIWVEGDEVTNEQELRVKLRAARQGDSAASKLMVQAHGDAQFNTVVMVLDAGNDVKMDEVRLAVVDDEAEDQP